MQKKCACKFFQRPQTALALRAREILLVFEKINLLCLFIPYRIRNHVITYTNILKESMTFKHLLHVMTCSGTLS